MRTIQKTIWIILAVVVMLLALPQPALAQAPDNGDKIVFGGNYRLVSGENLNGNLVVLGGTAILEENTHVNGNIVVVGGTAEVSGIIEGDVAAVGGSVNLNDTAIVHGSVNTIGASLRRSEKAVVEGDVHIENSDNLGTILPSTPILPKLPGSSIADAGLKTIVNILWGFLQALAMAALAIILALFLVKQMERVGQTMTKQPVLSAGFGLLTAIVAPGLLILLAITLILIPLSLVGILALVLSIVFGWVVIGLEIGNRLAEMLKVEWPTAVAAGLGTLLLSLLSALLFNIPCVGWVLPVTTAIVGLGAVLLSRFGTHLPEESYTSTGKQPPAQTASTSGVLAEVPSARIEDATPSESLPATEGNRATDHQENHPANE
jgi:hypothetical protein